MKTLLQFVLVILLIGFMQVQAQVLYSNSFTSSLGTASATGGSNGNWIWTGTCSQNTTTGHSIAGAALFQGSGCDFGNGSNTVSGNLETPTIAIGATGGSLTFNYFLSTECQSPGFTCFYDNLNLDISTNGGASWTTLMSSSGSPAGIVETSSWTPVTFNLNPYSNQTIKIRFNFNSLDGVANSYDGVYVDDIIITGNCPLNIFSNGTNTVATICSGSSATLTTNAVSNYSWSTGSNGSSIVVAPTTNTVYSLVATSSLNCQTSASIAVIVSGGLPSLSVTTSANPICLGMSTTFSATGALSYTWSGGVVNGQTFTPSATTAYTLTGANGCGISTTVRTITVSPLSVSAVTSSSLVCQGSGAVLTGSAAATGYTWMPGSLFGQTVQVTPIVNTVYTVAASDGTCSGTQTVLVTTKTTPTITANTSSLSVCAGVNVTLTASGAGTGGTYSWSPGGATTSQIVVAPLASVGYIVYGTNSLNCTSSAQQPVIVQNTPLLTITANKVLICSGNTVSLTASGATSYSWTGGPFTANYSVVQTAASAVYTVQGSVVTSSCVGSNTIAVTAIVPNVTVPSSIAICIGSSAVLTASGANTYTWNSIPVGASGTIQVTPTSNTIYTVQANTSSVNVSCFSTHSTQVVVNALPSITVVPTKSLTCSKQTNTLTATGALTYTWSTGSTANTATINPTTSSFYTVNATDANGCKNTLLVQAKVSTCPGINELNASVMLNVYPNPNNGNFIISGLAEVEAKLFDELGRHLQTLQLNSAGNYQGEIRNLAAGVYFLAIESEGNVSTKKIIVTQ